VRVGFDRWINTDDERELADVLRESLARLETLVAPG
jgi:hypothetical protein